MTVNVHAGHNPDGKIACGAVGFLQESTEARKVKDEVICQLRQMGHTVYDCTCENGTGQSDVLFKIVNACNAHMADLDISIHFNAGAGDAAGNGRTTGTEVLVYNTAGRAKQAAERVCANISSLGFKNRGIKANTSLYFLRKTKAPAMLIECCFVDDRDDVQLYDCQKMASAIVRGITGKDITEQQTSVGSAQDKAAGAAGAETKGNDVKELYRVQVIKQHGAFHVKENAERLQRELLAAGFDAVIVKA